MTSAWLVRVVRLSLLLIFVGGGIAAVSWWWGMPQGFPIMHARFWANSVFPLAVVGVCLTGVVLLFWGNDAGTKCVVLGLGSMVIAAGVTAAWLFPVSVSGRLLLVVGVVVIGVLLLMGLVIRVFKVGAGGSVLACVAAGVFTGVGLLFSQRGADPETQPAAGEGDIVLPQTLAESGVADVIRIEDQVTVSPTDGRVVVGVGKATVEIRPLLTFVSRSPDRFWTLFAPGRERVGPARSLVGVAEEDGVISLGYKDDGISLLNVSDAEVAGARVRMEARSWLSDPVYSHLNSFAVVAISECKDLGLSFSPCPEVVKVMPFDYPVGRPARLAYLDSEGGFHVVEASSGEKGPFTALTSGVLEGDKSLRVTFYSGGRAVGWIDLEDWAKQASGQLSPTAGWGLPENAIEFFLAGDGTGFIYFTLAGTSVGRGWDSVGHRAGTYRNVVTVGETP